MLGVKRIMFHTLFIISEADGFFFILSVVIFLTQLEFSVHSIPWKALKSEENKFSKYSLSVFFVLVS